MKLASAGFLMVLLITSTLSARSASEPIKFTSDTRSILEFSAVLMGEYDFDLHNNTTGWVLNGFYSQENGKWSKNWLKAKVQPGKSVHMVWNAASNEGDCVVPFATSWDGYTEYEKHSVDWCKKPIKAIHLLDDAKLRIVYK